MPICASQQTESFEAGGGQSVTYQNRRDEPKTNHTQLYRRSDWNSQPAQAGISVLLTRERMLPGRPSGSSTAFVPETRYITVLWPTLLGLPLCACSKPSLSSLLLRWLRLIWSLLVLFGMLKGWGRSPLAEAGDSRAFAEAVQTRIDKESRGNTAFILIENGNVEASQFQSIGAPVGEATLFQVASLSKWITAWGVMSLAEDGKIDLDAPVSNYVTRWSLPASKFDPNGVTVRRLLSHTAGLTDGLGYMGFAPGEELQTLEQSLTRAADAVPLLRGEVVLGAVPGSAWRYSGGGYTLLQLMIEEVSGQSFNTYMKQAVLDPLGMTNSSFEVGLDDTRLAEFYDADGQLTPHQRYTAKAAASLYTSASDLTLFLQAHLPGANGEVPGRGVLLPETLESMRRPEGFVRGVPMWGLGTILYAPSGSGGHIIGHDGDNAPAITTAARLDPDTGAGVIVLSTGHKHLAHDLADEWIHWRTGSVSPLSVNMMDLRTLAVIAANGPSQRDWPALLIWLAGMVAVGLTTFREIRSVRRRNLESS